MLTHLVDASIDAPLAVGTQGPGQVQWKLSCDDERLHIDVVDNGAGLPQEQLDLWFKDWDLGHALPPSDAGGLMSWRLLVVRAWVQRLGGRFDARSTPGHGNRWSADLPLVRASVTGQAG